MKRTIDTYFKIGENKKDTVTDFVDSNNNGSVTSDMDTDPIVSAVVLDEQKSVPQDFSETEKNSHTKSRHTFQPKWLAKWSWLQLNKDHSMICTLCQKHGKMNTLTKGCDNFRTSTLERHLHSSDNRLSVESDVLCKNFSEVSIKLSSTAQPVNFVTQ